MLDKIAHYLLDKETITGQEMMFILEGKDPALADNYGAKKIEEQKAFRPSQPDVIEAPARHIHMVSEPVVAPPLEEAEEEKPETEEKPEE